jgi:hypothetical protein
MIESFFIIAHSSRRWHRQELSKRNLLAMEMKEAAKRGGLCRFIQLNGIQPSCLRANSHDPRGRG